ncbi:MAG: protein phosphatase 2C domain-containing protein [Acidobacteriota bacterium]
MQRFHLEVGSATDVGKQRQRNEDSYAVFTPTEADRASHLDGLLLVADGMGGERAGDRASQITAARLKHWFVSGEYRAWPEFQGEAPLETALVRAVRSVSSEIFQIGEDEQSVRGLGSTVVLGLLAGDRMVLAHVGDSRAYLRRGDVLRQLTVDHSWVQRQVDAGVLSAEAARRHPQRNILTRSLGDSLPPEVDLTSLEVRGDDVFVLCSDGMTGGIEDETILEMARAIEDPQQLAEALVERANDVDGSDNITVVVGRCSSLGVPATLEEAAARTDSDITQVNYIEDDATQVLANEDTEVDLDAPTLELRRGGRSTWRTWLAAALLALALGLLVGIAVQRLTAAAPADLDGAIAAPS